MAKILKENCSFGQRLQKIENLFKELRIEMIVEEENIIFIDKVTNTKVRLAEGSGYRDNVYNFPRRFDDEKYYNLGE